MTGGSSASSFPMTATIRLQGATASLTGIRGLGPILRACLSFQHPGARFSKAFRQGRWDGNVLLANGHEFPVGLLSRVRAELKSRGIRVKVRGPDVSPVDAPGFDENYLDGVTLRDYQMEVVRKLLDSPRGAFKLPTGSGKTAMIAAAARLFWEHRKWKTLIVVPRKGLATQTRASLRRFYRDEIRVGIASEGVRKPGVVTVATAQTLAHFEEWTRRKKRRIIRMEADEWLRELIEGVNVLFLDECHRTKSDQWQRVSSCCPAARRYGLSGTPLRDQEFQDVKLEAQVGPLVHSVEATALIERKVLAKPKIVMVMSDHASDRVEKVLHVERGRQSWRNPVYRDAYRTAIVEGERHNRAVIASVKWLHDRGRRVLVLCRMREHFVKLAESLQDVGIEAECLWGATRTSDREDAKIRFGDGDVRCILATTIFDEGEDVGGIDAIVMAEGISANTSALQRIGRGMRAGKPDVWVVDFVPTGSATLREHAARRADVYEQEGYEVVVLEEWPRKLNEGKPPKDLLPFATWARARSGPQ